MEKALSVLLKVPNKMNYSTKYIGFTESIQKCPDFVCTPKGFKITGLLAYKPLGKAPCQILFDYLDNSPSIQPPIQIGFLLLGERLQKMKVYLVLILIEVLKC